MANAYGLVSSPVHTVRGRNHACSSIYRSGVCFSEVKGAEKVGAGVASSESRVPRLVSKGCKLVGCGSAVPALKVSNDDLAKLVDTNDEWISVRTGIRNRRVLSGDILKSLNHYFGAQHVNKIINDWKGTDSLTALAAQAAKKALEMAMVDPDDVDLVLLCTSTPEDLFGSAPQIPRALGCTKNPLAFDITAACSGFILGLVTGSCYIRAAGFKNVLVIGADSLSRYVDWTDRGTCILFGDAAGAVLLQACDSDDDGLFGFDVHSDGDGQRHLNATMKQKDVEHVVGSNGSALGFPPNRSAYSCIQMSGNEVFRFAVRAVPQSIEYALQNTGLSASSIDWLLLHQANKRILDAVATRLKVPSERVISNLANYGNTSAASIPLALDEAVRSGKVQPGHTIATAGFGAGLTWGSAIVRWG